MKLFLAVVAFLAQLCFSVKVNLDVHDYRGDLDRIEIGSTSASCTITPTADDISAYIEDQFSGKTPVASTARPIAVMMVGGPGAGKSSCRRKFVSFGDNFINIDLDSVLMTLFPNTEDKVYDCIGQAVPVLQDLTTRALGAKYNIVNDGTGRRKTGGGASYDNLATTFKDHGYRVKVIAVYLPVALALGRIQKRAEQEHRNIDLDYTKQTYEAIEGLLPEYNEDKKHYDDVVITINFDNPLILFSRNGGCSPSPPHPEELAPLLEKLGCSLVPEEEKQSLGTPVGETMSVPASSRSAKKSVLSKLRSFASRKNK